MNPSSSAVYVPPRPNLGPEAWGTTPLPLEALAAAAGALLVSLLAVWWARRRLRARRMRLRRTSVPLEAAPSPSGNPREQVIAGSRAIRRTLAERLGPAWQARTTEEIANDAELAGLVPPEEFARLAAFLRLADRAKFGDEPDAAFEPGDDGEDWASLVASLGSLLNAAAGANAKSSG